MDLLETGKDADGLLDESRHEVLDFLRRRVGKVGLDGERGIGDVGEELERESRIPDEPEGPDRQRSHHDRDRSTHGSGDERSHYDLGVGFFGVAVFETGRGVLLLDPLITLIGMPCFAER